jgi:hypothetical protein
MIVSIEQRVPTNSTGSQANRRAQSPKMPGGRE